MKVASRKAKFSKMTDTFRLFVFSLFSIKLRDGPLGKPQLDFWTFIFFSRQSSKSMGLSSFFFFKSESDFLWLSRISKGCSWFSKFVSDFQNRIWLSQFASDFQTLLPTFSVPLLFPKCLLWLSKFVTDDLESCLWLSKFVSAYTMWPWC